MKRAAPSSEVGGALRLFVAEGGSFTLAKPRFWGWLTAAAQLASTTSLLGALLSRTIERPQKSVPS